MKITNRLKNRNSTRHHGGALLEFVLTFPFFLGLVFMMIDLMMYCYALVSAKYVVSHVAREAAVGRWSAKRIIDEIENEITTFGLIPYQHSVQDGKEKVLGCDVDTAFEKHVQICRVTSGWFWKEVTNVSEELHASSDFDWCEWKNDSNNRFGCTGSEGNGLVTDNDSVKEGYPMSIVFRFGYPMTSWFMFMGKHIEQPTKSYVPIQAEEIVRIEPTT